MPTEIDCGGCAFPAQEKIECIAFMVDKSPMLYIAK
jgi:hypothetical protein